MDEFRPRNIMSEVNLDGFQIVPGIMFHRQAEPTMTIWHTSIAFSSVCFSLLNDCESIQIMVNTKERKIIILPCPSKDKDAIHWRKSDQHQKSKKMDCTRFTQPIYKMWNLDKELHYRTSGRIVTSGGKVMLLFDFSHPETWKGLKMVGGIEE